MAGHAIDLDRAVRYGLIAAPAAAKWPLALFPPARPMNEGRTTPARRGMQRVKCIRRVHFSAQPSIKSQLPAVPAHSLPNHIFLAVRHIFHNVYIRLGR